MLTEPGWRAVVEAKEAAKLRKLEELKIGGNENKPFGGVAPEYVTLHLGKSDEARLQVLKLAEDLELRKTWMVERLKLVTQLIEEAGAVDAVVEFIRHKGGETGDTQH